MAFRLMLFLLLCALAPVAAFAQTADVPASADAGRQDAPLRPLAAPRPDTLREDMRSRAPELPPDVAGTVFFLRDIVFIGATAFPPQDLRAAFAALIGREVTVGELFAAMAALQQKYLDAGYTLSRVDIPEQPLAGGIITVRVIEGYAGKVVVDPALQSSALVQSVAARIARMRPLNTLMLERLMLVLSTRPGRETTAVLAPADDAAAPPGAVTLHLRPRAAAANGIGGYVSMDNLGSNYLGPWRGALGLRMARVLGSDADVAVSLMRSASAPELRQGAVDMSLPVAGASGAVASFGAGLTCTEPGEDLDALDVLGRSVFWRAGLTYPVILQRDRSWTIGAAFEYKNVATDILQARAFDDRLRTATLETAYSFVDRWYGGTQLGLAYTQGFDILGPRSDGVTNISRAQGKSAFRKMTARASRLQALPRNFDLLATVEGQYAWDPLLSAEEFGYGGSGIGRGYDSSEIVGDHGVALQLELRYTQALPDMQATAQPYAFYDIGRVWNIDPAGRHKISAASAGAGLRLSLPQGVDMDGALAVPLTRPADNAPHYSDPKGVRFLFSLEKQF